MAENEGVGSLEQQLKKIATQSSVDGLDAAFFGAIQPVARQLLKDGRTFELKAVEALDKSPEIAAVVAAVHLRSVETEVFWKPLLATTKTGGSTAPVADLKAVSAEARALMEILNGRPSSEMRDKVLLMATEAAARVEKWIPDGRKKGGGPKAARYGRGAFHQKEDEEGNPVERAATPRRVKREKEESAIGRIFGWIFTIAVIAGLGYGVFWFIQNNQPEPMTVDEYSRLVGAVQNRTSDEKEAVLEMEPGWVQQKARDRESDLRLMLTVAKREDLTSVRMIDNDGKMLGHLRKDGTIAWGADAKAADERRAEQERLAEELEEAQRKGKSLLNE